jgi:hypothetical protein
MYTSELDRAGWSSATNDEFVGERREATEAKSMCNFILVYEYNLNKAVGVLTTKHRHSLNKQGKAVNIQKQNVKN